jgi:hypothetical protein
MGMNHTLFFSRDSTFSYFYPKNIKEVTYCDKIRIKIFYTDCCAMSTSIPDNNDPIIGQNEEEFMLEECPSDDGEGDQSVVPYVGMIFQIDREAYTFYNRYAEHAGFSVRKATQSKSNQGVSSMRFFVINKGLKNAKKSRRCRLEVQIG